MIASRSLQLHTPSMRPCERSQNKGYRSPLGDVSLENKPFSSTILESKSSNENHKPNCEQISLESTFSQSHSSSSTILESQTPKPYSNFHFQDIFGNFHRFFRPYTYRFRALFVRVYPQGYCYSDDSEIVITKSHKAIISQTSYPTHAFALPKGASLARKILESIKQCKLWARFYYQRLFKLHRVNGSLALLHQATNYYHFLSESIAALEQIRRSGLEPDYYLLAQDMPYQRQMWQILQIPESKILPLSPSRLIQAKSLIVPTLIANFESVEWRDGILLSRTLALPMLLQQFYKNFAKLLPPQESPKKRKIFLTRPSGSNRHLENTKEVESIFTAFGYEIILPDDLSLVEQACMARESSIIASMHGAGLSNAFFMQEGAVVFEIFPQYYHYSCPQFCALLMGCRYFYMVAQTTDTTPHPQQESAYVCPKELQKALQKLESYL
ncbi:glycosyltransferase family 61 protein [Helicobacter sp. XJK30-2]|uniref:Glycosyltransferase family 61 protein n=1 Tax=Helicobacter zhangjianzhongii TaxID=2974574 RepID=A0ACC6FPY5_9HELI|nr:glycosyltransferase family 61 protein [Helicobacter sp. XJK30-2]MDL0081137.1 glycosyltransferase family 61 protein [Helicobacter sp. XJK30-2]